MGGTKLFFSFRNSSKKQAPHSSLSGCYCSQIILSDVQSFSPNRSVNFEAIVVISIFLSVFKVVLFLKCNKTDEREILIVEVQQLEEICVVLKNLCAWLNTVYCLWV